MLTKKARDYLRYKRYCTVVYDSLDLTDRDVMRMSAPELRHAIHFLRYYTNAARKCGELRQKYAEDWIPLEDRTPNYAYPIELALAWATTYEGLLQRAYERLDILTGASTGSSEDQNNDNVTETEGTKGHSKRKGKGRKGRSAVSVSNRKTSDELDEPDWADLRRQQEREIQEEREAKVNLVDEIVTRFSQQLELEPPDIITSGIPQNLIDDGTLVTAIIDAYLRGLHLFHLTTDYDEYSLKDIRQGFETPLTRQVMERAIHLGRLDTSEPDDDFKTTTKGQLEARKYALLHRPDQSADTYRYLLQFKNLPSELSRVDRESLSWYPSEYHKLKKFPVEDSLAVPSNWLSIVRQRVKKDDTNAARNQTMNWDLWADLILKVALWLRRGQFQWTLALHPKQIVKLGNRLDLETINDKDRQFLLAYFNAKDKTALENCEGIASYCSWVVTETRWDT